MHLKDKLKNLVHHESKEKDSKESPVSASTSSDSGTPSKNEANVPVGVAQAEAQQQDTHADSQAGDTSLDSLNEPIIAPPHIAQRLAEHQEQFSNKDITKEDIDKDIAEKAAKKAAYEEEHRLKTDFEAGKATHSYEANLPEPAPTGIADHREQFGNKDITVDDVKKDLDEHEARRQALLNEKSQKAGQEVLEAKKKAEEHNDGAGAEDGRDAPEQPGIFAQIKTAVGL